MKNIFLGILLAAVALPGCALPQRGSEPAVMMASQLTEPAWIRNGEPLVFEGEDWFPTDETENLLADEVYQAGVFRQVPFFIEKTDVRPYERLYTYFSKNRYRAFQQ